MMPSSLVRLCGLAVVLCLNSAHGASRTDDELRKLNERGKTAFAQKKYREALEAFQAAHRISGLPGYLFNIATVQRVLGECDEALLNYRRYLAAVPNAENRDLVATRIADVEKCAARTPANDSAAAPREAAPPARDADLLTPDAHLTGPADSPGSLPPEAVKSSPQSPARRSVGPWLTSGLGLAITAAGGVTLGLTSARYAALSNSCSTACDPISWRGYDVAEALGWAGLAVGGTMLLVGVLWRLLE